MSFSIKAPHDVFETVTDFMFSEYLGIVLHSNFHIINQIKSNEPADEKIFIKPKP